MSKSVKINYIFNLINTVSGLLFPLITFPYASRVMMADGIGHVNFYQSIIQHITLLSCLGIPMYAIREIAKVRDNIEERNKTAMEILLLHAMLTTLGYIGVAIIASTVEEVMADIPLFIILSLTIFFTTIGCEWFYKGIEDFKYITIRGLIVKIISALLLFLLVKSPDDLYWYAVYTVIGVLGGNIFNFLRLRRYISLGTICIRDLHPQKHLLPALHIFALNLITSLYVQLNTVMLGFMSSDTAVGLFTAASKLSHMLLGISGALGTAMLPRMSNLIATDEMDEFKAKSEKAMKFMVATSLPITVGLVVAAPILIPLFSGETYQPAVFTLQLIAPIVLAISMSNVTGIQILYPMGKVNIVILTTGIGALVNFLLNLWLIPAYQQDGAAISTTIAEIAVTASMLIAGRKYFSFHFFSKSYLYYIVAAVLMYFSIAFIDDVFETDILNLLVTVVTGMLVYVLSLLFLKETLVCEMLHGLVAKLTKK